MQNPKYPPLGTISEGTMLNRDLIPSLYDALRTYDPEGAAKLNADYARFLNDAPSSLKKWDELCEEDDASILVGLLMDYLDAIAPPYAYFGSHPGDGSDYGFWPNVEGLEEDAEEASTVTGGSVVKVSERIASN